jgi:hypothetical protein
MRQRLAAQFGLGVFALAFIAGAALADSSTTPGSVNQQNDQTTVTIQGATTASVQTSQAQSQAVVGPSSPGDGSAGSSGGATSTASDQSQPSLLLSQSSPTPPMGSDPSPATDPSSALAGSAVATTPTATLAAATVGIASDQLATTVEAAITRITQDNAGVTVSAVTPPARPSAAPAPGLPTAPLSPAGFLDELHTLLSSTIIPATLGLGGLAIPLVPALAVLVTLALLIALPVLALPLNTYTARLRQSGFLGAARSDVGAASFLFATPLEMGCIGASASGRTHF